MKARATRPPHTAYLSGYAPNLHDLPPNIPQPRAEFLFEGILLITASIVSLYVAMHIDWIAIMESIWNFLIAPLSP